MDVALVEYGPYAGASADTLVHFMGGNMDPGAAGRLATQQLIDATVVGRVATFNSDELVDYRASRPTATVSSWQIEKIEPAKLVIDLATDLDGRNFLLLHGPEPDFRWEALSETVYSICQRAGIKRSMGLFAMPAGLPHTRPLSVFNLRGQRADNDSLIGTEESVMQLSASFGVFLTQRLAGMGLDSGGQVVSVPYYLFESDFYPAATELLRALASRAELTLPLGDLEAASSVVLPQIESMVEENPEARSMITGLEETYDQRDHAEAGDTQQLIVPSTDEIGEQLETFLRAQADKRRAAQEPPSQLPWGRLSRRRRGWPFGTSRGNSALDD